ncbi:translation initiation factor IF-3 [Candidatus Gracilibacteria bacterium]|nr:translation initiation factor IF-3 [Candidatus Gracilibacteria bacterium]
MIDQDENQVGIMGLSKALEMARAIDADLVEVAPNLSPPVCKIMDYGKHLYRQKKQEQKQKAMQKQTEVKGLRLSLRTSDHDLEIKANQARRFFKDRNLVKVSLVFRGRENAHQELGFKRMEDLIKILGEDAEVDQPPKRQGNNLMMILAPSQNFKPQT